jgi:glycosyltransferase XagB
MKSIAQKTVHRKELFLDAMLLTVEEEAKINSIASKYNQSFLRVALNYGFLARKKFKQELQKYYSINFKISHDNLAQYTFFEICNNDLEFFLNTLVFPVSKNSEGLEIVLADPTDFINIRKIEEKFSAKVTVIHVADDLDIIKALHMVYGQKFLHQSVFSLYEKDPESCAIETFTFKQVIFLGLASLFFLVVVYFEPIKSILTLNLALNIILFISIAFKFFLTIAGAKTELETKVKKKEIQAISDDELPIYTILLPVFKESEVIYKLAWNLRSLDYPLEKLDVKILIESDDEVTLNAVRDMQFPCIFEPVIIPYGMPKTKPKACNYGLYFSKGKYLTIYDAEDIPDSDQLKKVYALFKKLPENYVVIQCALNYFNKSENFLTRMFTLEYSYWFDYMLPGLDRLNIPIPLGGTSNHFKFDKLMELGGWDGFNVTEDADLGLRAYAKEYKVTVLESTTFEEANNDFFNWIRQRSRWIKGYMQTYLVHMRHPIELFKKVGWKGFFGFQFFIGGTFFTFLVYPLLLLTLIFYMLFESPWITLFFPDWLVIIAIINFTAGNLLMIYANMIAIFKRRSYSLLLFSIANPVYWLMHSISAYKGLHQLIVKPFYWEKTNHGLTKMHKK